MLRPFIAAQHIGYLKGFLEGVGIPTVSSTPIVWATSKTAWTHTKHCSHRTRLTPAAGQHHVRHWDAGPQRWQMWRRGGPGILGRGEVAKDHQMQKVWKVELPHTSSLWVSLTLPGGMLSPEPLCELLYSTDWETEVQKKGRNSNWDIFIFVLIFCILFSTPIYIYIYLFW